MIGLEITGSEQVIAKLGEMTGKIRIAASSSLDMWATELAGYIRLEKLKGQVLNKVTGHLSDSVRPIKTGEFSTATTISAGSMAGDGVPYAKIHEYGMQRNIVVSAFHRMQTMAWGKPITPVEVLVNQHSSYINMPERSYMRSSLREEAPQGIEALKQAVREAIV
jgi:hypothetical protein